MTIMRTLSPLFILLFFSCAANKQLPVAHKDILSISFFSRGAGTDYKMRIELDKYLNEFQKNERLSLQVEQKKWGREGEVDYCIALKPLAKNKLNKLLQGTKLLLGSSDLVRITEEDNCRH